jgi:hypothetical protein
VEATNSFLTLSLHFSYIQQPQLSYSAGSFTRARLPDVCYARNGLAVVACVEGGHDVVINVPLVAVLQFGDSVKADVPVFGLKSHRSPNKAVDAGNGGVYGTAVIVELSNWVGESQAVQNHRCCLGARDVVPVEHGIAFLFGHFPSADDAANYGRHVGIVG